MEVVPLFLGLLDEHAEDWTQTDRFPLMARVWKRLNEGMKKYGKPFATHDGRNSLLDAWEEACDGAQYLIKADCEGKLKDRRLITDQIKLLLRIERELL